MTLPILETPRLILREVTPEDIPSYKKHFVDYEVIRQLSDQVPWPYPEDGIEYFLNNVINPAQGKDRWMWGIFLKSNTSELIGAVDLWRQSRPENRGFWLGRKFWGQGFMTEACEAVNKCAFEQLGFEKIGFANAVGNTKSRRIKEKTGAKFLGVAPAKFVDPQYTEHELWELTKEDWSKR